MIRTRRRRTTGQASRPTLASALGILALFSVALPLLAGATAAAAPTELKAKVVWLRGDRVYVASAESLAVEEGDVLRFRSGKKEIAAGSVADTRDPGMVVASLTSGSLRKEKKLEKIRIFAERPPLRPLPTLRVGCPSPSRPCLLFACDSAKIGASLPSGAYRADTLSPRSYRFVRDTTVVLAGPWPDTLLVRAFDESADEEIALERGELDVAVFWPGELSPHMREDARWKGFLYGVRSVGCVFAADPLDPADTQAALGALNRAIFAEDLAPIGRSGQGPTSTPPVTRDLARDVRLKIDHSIRAFAVIQRALDQISGPSTPSERAVRVFYVRVQVEDRGPSFEQGAATFLSSIRCPVVSNGSLRRTVRALGPNAFADLLGCGGSGSGR